MYINNKTIGCLLVTPFDLENHIDLFYLREEDNDNYCYIKDF